MARRNRFAALFGKESVTPFLDLYKIRGEVVIAVRMLVQTHQHRTEGSLPNDRKQWETAIGWRPGPEDAIPARVESVIQAIETICRPAMLGGGGGK